MLNESHMVAQLLAGRKTSKYSWGLWDLVKYRVAFSKCIQVRDTENAGANLRKKGNTREHVAFSINLLNKFFVTQTSILF